MPYALYEMQHKYECVKAFFESLNVECNVAEIELRVAISDLKRINLESMVQLNDSNFLPPTPRVEGNPIKETQITAIQNLI